MAITSAAPKRGFRATKAKAPRRGTQKNLFSQVKLRKRRLVKTKTLVVRADTDEAFAQLKAYLIKLPGVTIKAEAPARRALSVAVQNKPSLPTTLRQRGLTVRDEVVYAPDAEMSAG
jgi:hypothetical protein